MAFLELAGIAKSFGETEVLRDVSLAVEEGETLVLLGPSGSGKTTLLRIIAGFESADSGDVHVAGGSVAALPPARRNFGMVFQHYALFPHLTVGENVAFGLESRDQPRDRISAAVEQALERVDLGGFAERRIGAISGGQQQRVALARALAPEPRLLLLDEPLSNLDPELRERTRQELAATLAHIGITAVWVTHEQEEAFDVGTRVAVLHEGQLEQIGSPQRLYREPETPFVAGFIGRTSVFHGRLASDGSAQVGGGADAAVRFAVTGPGLTDVEVGGPVAIYIRPEAWEVVAQDSTGALGAVVVGLRFAGRENLVRVKLDQGAEIEFASEKDLAIGDRVGLRLRDAAPPAAFPLERDPA